MDLPELQIDDILRYLSEDDNEESAASLPHLMYQPHHLSHRLHRPVLLHSIRGWQPPLKDSLDLLKAILHYYNHHTYTKRVTRDGRHAWRVRMCFDDGLPMMFNHNIAGAAKQLSTPLVKVSTELLTSKRSRQVPLLSVEYRLLARTTDR